MRQLLAALSLACALLPGLAAAQPTAPDPAVTSQAPADAQPLRVAISEVPPFVIKEADGSWRGISIDLWSQIAQGLGRPFELVPMPFQQVLTSVESGQADVAVGAITMTAEREERVDFTHPFYQTGLAIAVRDEGSSGIWAVIERLFSWEFASVVLGLAGLLLLAGAALWLFERHRNAEQFGGKPAAGLGNSFWWAAVTMTTVGYGDKAPLTLGGRLVAIVWMFAGLIVVSGFTAAITSALTVGSLKGSIGGPDDLRRANVATVAGTISQSWLRGERIRSSEFADVGSAMRAVQQGEADAVVYDEPILQFRNGELDGGGLRLLPGSFENQAYAFAVRNASPLREPIGLEILRITNSSEWPELKRKYLGERQ